LFGWFFVCDTLFVVGGGTEFIPPVVGVSDLAKGGERWNNKAWVFLGRDYKKCPPKGEKKVGLKGQVGTPFLCKKMTGKKRWTPLFV